MVEDLRERMIQDEDIEVETEKADQGLLGQLLKLQPRQRLILAVLLFLDVALCGCMGLVMMGRVLPRF